MPYSRKEPAGGLMHQNHVTVKSIVAECVETSDCLRKFLLSGQEMAANVRRDVATAANLLVALGIELKEGQQRGTTTLPS